MTTIIMNVMVLDVRDLVQTNLKNKTLSKDCFDWDATNSKVLFSKYGVVTFDGTLGLCNNFSRDNNKIFCDLELYDVNGFDVELPPFIRDGLSKNAFKIRPLIGILMEGSGIVTKAQMISIGLVV